MLRSIFLVSDGEVTLTFSDGVAARLPSRSNSLIPRAIGWADVLIFAALAGVSSGQATGRCAAAKFHISTKRSQRHGCTVDGGVVATRRAA